jgi:phosphoenolpyruvate carboxykinase (GTP)
MNQPFLPRAAAPDYVRHARAIEWVAKIAAVTKPDHIHWCDGSQGEYDRSCEEMVRPTMLRLNPAPAWRVFSRARPDRRRAMEDRTSHLLAHGGRRRPDQQPIDPAEMRATLGRLFDGCMRGRTLYVVPFSMGPLGSHISQIGIELTDSPYVVVSMRVMTRMTAKVWDLLGADGDFVPCVHSVGAPLRARREGRRLPHKEHKYIVHFETRDLVVRSDYGGNALLGKKLPAHRLGDGATKAGSPSTCSFSG